MTAFLKAADLTREQLLDLLNDLGHRGTDSPQQRVWMEAPDGWAFDWWCGLAGNLYWCGAGREQVEKSARDYLVRSTAGRLFAPDGELRWRIIPALGESCWRTVFLGNVDWVGTTLADHSDCLDALHPHQDSFFLWGQQTDATPDEWIELRIPHRFRYPISDNSRSVKVVVEQWEDDTGEPHFVRLCDLKPYQEKK